MIVVASSGVGAEGDQQGAHGERVPAERGPNVLGRHHDHPSGQDEQDDADDGVADDPPSTGLS